MTSELGILFLHHESNEVVRNNLARIRQEHPGATLVTISAGERLPGGYSLQDTPELVPYHSANKRHGADWLVCSWFKQRRESCRKWWIAEWDVFCAMPVFEYYQPVWEFPFVASCIRRLNFDPTGWLWRDNLRLPLRFQPYVMAAVPFVYLIQEPALAAICSTLIANPFAEGNCELRFGTVANWCGFAPCGYSPPDDQIGWVAHAKVPNRRGIFHPVKFIPDFTGTPAPTQASSNANTRGDKVCGDPPQRTTPEAKAKALPRPDPLDVRLAVEPEWPLKPRGDFSILFLHHEINEVVRNNLASIRRHHPTAMIVTMSAAEALPGGYSLDGTPVLKPYHAADPTQGADWLVCSWFLQRREFAKKWWIVEWDVYCTMSAQEHYHPVWEEPFVATTVRLRHRDPQWFPTRSFVGIPPEFRGHWKGPVPFLYLMDERALDLVCSVLVRQPFTGGNCALRFGSAGSMVGFAPCGFCPPNSQIGSVPWFRIETARGIFHPVSFSADHEAVSKLKPGEFHVADGPPLNPSAQSSQRFRNLAPDDKNAPPTPTIPSQPNPPSPSNGSDSGILYLNTGGGPQRADLLRNSLRSLAATNPGIPFHVLTDAPTDFPFTWVDSLPHQRSREIKTSLPRFTPYDDLTLFLDDDTVLAKPIDLVKMIGQADLAMSRDMLGTVGQAAVLTRLRGEFVSRREVEETLARCGANFPMFNSGVLLFRNRKAVRKLFERWHEEWTKYKACDQFALARALHATGIEVKQLPSTFNQPISRAAILGHLGLDLSTMPIIENFPVSAGMAVPPDAHIYHLLAKQLVGMKSGLWQPMPPGPMEAAFSRAVERGQMTRRQYGFIAREIMQERPCTLLMVGSGFDSELWWQCTQGQTTYVEDNPAYLPLIPGNPVSFRYPTKIGIRAARIKTPAAIDRSWDFVLVDGPSGFGPAFPGRELPIAWAAKLGRKAVMVHDYDRPWERQLCDQYLGEPTLVISAEGRIDRKLAVFRRWKSVARNSIRQKDARSPSCCPWNE